MFLDPALMKSASMCKFSAARHPRQGGPRQRSDRVEGRAEGNPRVLARGIVGERFVQFPALKLSALHSDRKARKCTSPKSNSIR